MGWASWLWQGDGLQQHFEHGEYREQQRSAFARPFLNALRREHVFQCPSYLVNGIKLQAKSESFDQYGVTAIQ